MFRVGTVEDDLPMEVERGHQVKVSSCEPRWRPPPLPRGIDHRSRWPLDQHSHRRIHGRFRL